MRRFVSNVFYIVGLIALFLPPTSAAAANPVTISLVPGTLSISPGQQFNVDVVLNNPYSEGLVGIGLWIKYDKDLLNVVDTDTGNWVTAGTNILDGSYHNPFDLPGDPGIFDNLNDADTDGEIKWDARRSFSDFTNIYPSGTFATITFQAEGNLGSTALAFYGTGTGGVPDTYIMNESAEQILTGTSGATVSVIPEPASLVLMATGLSMLVRVLRRK